MQAFLLRSSSGPLDDLPSLQVQAILPFVPEKTFSFASEDRSLVHEIYAQSTSLFADFKTACQDPTGLTGFNGFVWPAQEDAPKNTAQTIRRQLKTSTLRGFVEHWQGQYVVSHNEEHRAAILVDPLASEVVFWARTNSTVAFSNRLELVALALGLGLDVQAEKVAHHIAFGILPDRTTPYSQIHTLGVGECATIHHGQLDIDTLSPHPIRDIPHAINIDADSDDYWQGAITRLQRNLQFVKNPRAWAELGLSGGKDSRLIFALAFNMGIKEKLGVFTNGDAHHPDVLVAQSICRWARVPHEHRPPSLETPLAPEQQMERLHEKVFPFFVRLNEGMQTVWDARGRGPRDDRVMLSGLNGDWYRSSLDAHGQDTSWVQSSVDARRFLSQELWLDPAKILRPELRQQHLDWRNQWLEEMLARGVPSSDIPNLFYVLHQSSRRNANTKRFGGWMHHRVDVLLSHDLLALAFAQGAQQRRDERIHFELMRRTSQDLTRIPFANDAWSKRWGSHQTRPITRTSAVNKATPKPPWREMINHRSDYRESLKNRFLAQTSSPLFDIVDRGKLEKLLTKPKLSFQERMALYGVETTRLILLKDSSPIRIPTRDRLPGSYVRLKGAPEGQVRRSFRGELFPCKEEELSKNPPRGPSYPCRIEAMASANSDIHR